MPPILPKISGLHSRIACLIFSLISSKYSLMMNPDILRKMFAVFTIIAGVYIYFTKEDAN